MPLFKTIEVSEHTKVFIWKIEEPLEQLVQGVSLMPERQKRVDDMRSEIHQRGFMSVRHLLALEGYQDTDLFYDILGKPHLKDGKYISISHSYHFSAIIVSDERHVGIDIEKQRAKIVRIAHKFTPVEAYKAIDNKESLVKKLTIVWGAKESLYKIYEQAGLSFIRHIYIHDFKPEQAETTGIVNFKGKTTSYEVHFLEFEGFTCVYALIK